MPLQSRTLLVRSLAVSASIGLPSKAVQRLSTVARDDSYVGDIEENKWFIFFPKLGSKCLDVRIHLVEADQGMLGVRYLCDDELGPRGRTVVVPKRQRYFNLSNTNTNRPRVNEIEKLSFS